MKLLVLFLLCISLSFKAQKITLDTIHKINTSFNFLAPVQKSNVLSFKYQNLFAVTMQPNLNKSAFQAPSVQQGISTAFQYDVRTKFYINKKMSFIFRTQLSAVSNIASIGLSFKFK